MDSNVAGIETADYEVRTVEHTVEALTELFRGAAVVCNTVGPFARYGPEVVEAALAAGAHYLDTTGEQDWVITCDEKYGADFAAAGLLLSPRASRRCTPPARSPPSSASSSRGSTPSTSPSSGAGAPPSPRPRPSSSTPRCPRPTTSSRTSYAELDPSQGLYQLVDPRASTSSRWPCPWGGTSPPGVVQARPARGHRPALGGVFNNALMHGVPQIVAAAIEATKDMDPDAKYAALDATAAQVMNPMPPRENPRLNKSLDSVHASGPLGRAHCVIHGNSNYKQTGLLQAYAAYSLLQQPPRRSGSPRAARRSATASCSVCSACFGLVMEPVLTVER